MATHSLQYSLFIAATALVSFAGCADGDGGEPGWSIDDDTSFASSDVSSRDTTADIAETDVGADTDAAEVDAACGDLPHSDDGSTRRCAPQEVSTFYLRDLGRTSGVPRSPIVMGDSVYFQRDYGDTIAILAQRIGSGEDRVVYESEDYLILEAAAGGRLFTSIHDTDSSFEAVHVRDTRGAVIDEYSTSDSLTLRTVVQRWTTGAAPQVFDGERYLVRGGSFDITMLEVSNGVIGVAELVPWDHHLRTRPVLTDRGFAYTAAPVEGGTRPLRERDFLAADVFAFQPGAGRRQITDTPRDERYIFADDGVLYWIDEKGVYAKNGERPTEQIYRGRCGAPHAFGGNAVFACAGPNDGMHAYGEPITSRLLLYDGEQVREIPLDGDERMVFAPRISSDGIAWVEFGEREEDSCSKPNGRVIFYDFDSERQFTVGEAPANVWCRPAVNLSVRKRTIAWWPAPVGSAPLGTRRPSAYAVIEPPICCDD